MASDIIETGNALFTEGEKIGEIYGNRLYDNNGNIIAEKYGNVITGDFTSGGGVIGGFHAQAKVDGALQSYLTMAQYPQNEIVYNNDNKTFTFNKSGKYKMFMFVGCSGGSSSATTTITINKNGEIIDTFNAINSVGAVYKIYDWTVEEGDTFNIYNTSSGWHTIADILILKG